MERYEAQRSRLNAIAQAESAVQAYESHLAALKSLHNECLNSWDWPGIASSRPPPEPVQERKDEVAARLKLDHYKPGFVSKAFRIAERRRRSLERNLEETVRLAEAEYRRASKAYTEQHRTWTSRVGLARRILHHEASAYLDAIRTVGRFDQIPAGKQIYIAVHDDGSVVANVRVHGEDVVPNFEIKALRRGGLSQKDMPRTRFYALYQDYVSSAVLRIAREIFGLLPVEMVIVNAIVERVNQRTGHLEEQTILSTAVAREIFNRLNLLSVDPSEAISNFAHRMDFKRTSGFGTIESIQPSEITRPGSRMR